MFALAASIGILFCYSIYKYKLNVDSKGAFRVSIQQKYHPRIAEIWSSVKSPLQPKLKNAEDSSTTEDGESPALNDGALVELAVQSFKKNEESLNRAWRDYRVQVYKNIGVEGGDLTALDELLSQHLDVIEEIQREMSTSPYGLGDEEYEAMSAISQQAYASMDENIEKFLGSERFKYVKDARKLFNKAYQEKSKSHAEYIGW
ncbi:hypothetical protein ACLVWU_05605 [Bdellovibrio sp. HCB290]|uniref:hypothetical protein n=1 Tax=Bdellovibrio sp. HCB290 TaxID=3394356 RepID=UPI0039B6D60E